MREQLGMGDDDLSTEENGHSDLWDLDSGKACFIPRSSTPLGAQSNRRDQSP